MAIRTPEKPASGDAPEPPAYVSEDSAPQRFAVSRPWWLLPAFVAAFWLASVAVLAIPGLATRYEAMLGDLSGVDLGTTRNLAFRPLSVAFALVFWVFAAGGLKDRANLFVRMLGGCAFAILVTDLLLAWSMHVGGPGPFSFAGDLLAGYAGFVGLILAFLSALHLPEGEIVRTKLQRPRRYGVTLIACIAFSAGLAAFVVTYANREIDHLRNVALIGGLGPGVILFRPTLTASLFLVASLFPFRPPERTPRAPTVGFLVAALNEAQDIEDCIRSLDIAAARYGQRCRLYLVDNGSRDGTPQIARKALSRCTALDGEVLHCPEPGKSRALNHGLRHMRDEEIVVRVDADSVIEPAALEKMVPYFAAPEVGGVSGVPLPKNGSTLLGRLRNIEVLENVSFVRTGLNAIDAVNVLPGIMCAYRLSILQALGGFHEGINGEDTDMAIRVGRLGYRVISDPSITVQSEVPRSLAHLREQRLRWSRGALHVFARNKSAFLLAQGPRGLWTVPHAFIGVLRRGGAPLVLIYASAVAVVDPHALYLRDGVAVLAVLMGAPLILLVAVLLIRRRPGLLPFLPFYVGFRLLRSLFQLETLFTLKLRASVKESQATVPAGRL
ncbi:MAG TPA: glycosyltransferase family 2 protein [Dehalococcoidia bacterium]|nr:glycosyltransferase family 2 protein [Dehalococcoidia bacterium]